MPRALPQLYPQEEAEGSMEDGVAAAFADIVFLLLAFLVSVVSLKASTAIELPESQPRAMATADGPALAINIVNVEGSYVASIGGQSLPLDDSHALTEVFKALAAGSASASVELRADAQTPFAAIRAAMAAAQNAGCGSVSIITNASP